MKLSLFSFVLGIAVLTTAARSTPEKTNSISRTEVEEMTQSAGPQEESPFFIEREEARKAAAEAATNPIYKSPLLIPHHSMQQQLKNLTKQLLRMTKIGPENKGTLPLQILVEPASFSVTETPELNVSFKITNVKKEMLFLDFATNQRLDILVKEKNGEVILRWSTDRSFDPVPGIVAINPKESVLYTEKIPTVVMHDGTTYLLEASLVGHPDYTLTQAITPQSRSTSSSDPSFDE